MYEWESTEGGKNVPDFQTPTLSRRPPTCSTFTLLVVVRHWQVYFPVLANASYVSDLQAVWVVV